MALAAEQRKKIDEVIAPIKAEAMRTDPINQEECIAAFNAAYSGKKLPPPEYVFCTSPWDALKKVEARASEANYREILGEETHFYYDDSDFPLNRDDSLYQAASKRTEKMLMGFMALHNEVESGLEIYVDQQLGKFPSDTLLYHGYNDFWWIVDSYAMSLALEGLGVMKLPHAFALNCAALSACGMVFSFERCCFICERPELIHCPPLGTEGPRDRIIIKWRDGFVCDDEF